jgi:hypothetical protein
LNTLAAVRLEGTRDRAKNPPDVGGLRLKCGRLAVRGSYDLGFDNVRMVETIGAVLYSFVEIGRAW